MLFPSKDRVKFHNNPLIEVICQIHLVQDLGGHFLQPKLLIALHDEVRALLPLLHKKTVTDLHINADSQQVTQSDKISYEFSSFDGSTKVVFDGESIAGVTSKYVCRESFFETLYKFVDSLFMVVEPCPFSRVGLRYKDVVEKSKLAESCREASWAELINPVLLGTLADPVLLPHIQGMQSQMSLKMADGNNLQAFYGLAKNASTNELVFLLDSDCYKEGVLKYDDAKQFLLVANLHSRNFFHWAITEKLYHALGPERISEQ